jgi:hypothetical protein
MKSYLDALPALLPIPGLDRHIVTSCEHDAQRRMHGQASNVIRMRLKGGNLFMRVVVEDPELKVIRTGDKPVLSGDEFGASNGNFSNLEGFDESPGVVVVDVDGAVVQGCEEPWFCGMEID